MTDLDASSLFDQINEKKAELDRIIKEFGQQAVKEYLQGFWEKNPSISGLRWSQYTPYFNDGDPCVFRVNDVRFRFEDTPEDGGDYEDGYEDLWSYKYSRFRDTPREDRDVVLEQIPEFVAARTLNSIWSNNEMTMLSVFGDHVQITADRNKIEVDEYNHD